MKKNKQQLKPIDQRLYGYLHALPLSFYSSRLYIDVIKRWRGLGIGYLLFIIAIFTLPVAVRLALDFNVYFKQSIIFPLESLPPLYIQNGQVYLDKPMPYVVKNKNGKPIAVVDTTKTLEEITRSYPSITWFINKDTIHFKPAVPYVYLSTVKSAPDMSTLTETLPKGDNEVFIGKEWLKQSFAFTTLWVVELLIYPIMVIFFYIFFLSMMLMLAFLGQVFAQSLFAVKLRFNESSRILTVSATPAFFVFFLFLTTDYLFAGAGLIAVAILALYFSYAVILIKRERYGLVKR